MLIVGTCVLSAIKSALKQENLNPEIQEKLLQLQRYQERQIKQEKTEPTPVSVITTPVANKVQPKKRPPPSPGASPQATSVKDEWESPKRKVARIEVKDKYVNCVHFLNLI